MDGLPMGSSAFLVRLPHDSTAAVQARELVADLLSQCLAHPPRDLVADAKLVVHELVLNAVSHGEPDDEGRIEVSGRVVEGELVISVLDRGTRGTVAPVPFTEHGPSGRGLSMVAALSSRWTVDRSSGTRVSAWLGGASLPDG